MADGSIVINVKCDAKAAEKELGRLRQKVLRLESDMRESTHHKGALEQQLEAANKKLIELHNNAKKDAGGVLLTPEEAHQMETLTAEVERLQAEIDKYDQKIKDTEQSINDTKFAWGQLFEQQRQATAADPPGVDTEEAYSRLDQIKQRIIEVVQNTQRLTASAFKSIPGTLASVFSRVAGGIKKVFTGALSLAGQLGEKLLDVSKNFNVFSQLAGKLGPVFTKLGSMIRRVFVFSVVTSGLRYLRTQIGQYLSLNTQFMGALGQLKGVLLTAFQPIYDAIMPALTALINGVTRAIAVVAQFISALFGKTAKQSQTGAKALNKQAGALGSVGKEADKAAKSLAGFDEIQQLAEKDTPDGGGAAGGGGDLGAATFDYDFEESPIGSWGEAFLAFLDKILNDGIPRLKEGFAKFAEWFNDFNKKLLDMFTFEGVSEKVVQIGKTLAEAFNYLVNSIDWETFGAAIGAGIGLAILFAVNFLATFDWMELGNSLAEFINGAVSQINWEEFGRLLWEGFIIGIETLVGFLLGLDMKELSEAASNIVIGFVNAVSQFILDADWKTLIEKAVQQVADIAAGIDYAGIATAVYTALGVAFGAATSTLWELLQEAWDEVMDWWHDVAFEDGHFTMDGLLDGIKDALKNIGTWIYDNILTPFWDGFCKAFEIGSPSKLMDRAGHFIMDGLLQGLRNAWNAIPQFFSQIWQDIKNWWNNNISNFTDSDWWRELGSNMIDGLLEGLRSIFTGLSSWASDVWSSVTGIFSGSNARAAISNGMPSPIMRSALPNIPIMDVPALARGAVIPANREFLAVLGDQPHGTNIEAPLSTIQEAVRVELENQISAMMAGFEAVVNAIQSKNMEVTLDGSVIAESVNDYNMRDALIRGY